MSKIGETSVSSNKRDTNDFIPYVFVLHESRETKIDGLGMQLQLSLHCKVFLHFRLVHTTLFSIVVPSLLHVTADDHEYCNYSWNLYQF